MDRDDLKVIRQKPNQKLVDTFDRLRDSAKEGTIQGIVYVKLYKNGDTAHGWNIPANQTRRIPSLLGGMQLLATDLANDLNGIEPRIIKDG